MKSLVLTNDKVVWLRVIYDECIFNGNKTHKKVSCVNGPKLKFVMESSLPSYHACYFSHF